MKIARQDTVTEASGSLFYRDPQGSESESEITEVLQTGKIDFELLADQLPVPQGHKILVAIPEISDTYDTEDGEEHAVTLYKTSIQMDEDHTATVVGHVLQMGPDCYLGKRFPTGAWCEVGDFVTFRRYSGTRIAVSDIAYRIINDDTVECTVKDPRGIRGG